MHAAEHARQLRLTLLQERASGTFARVYLAEASSEGGISRIVAVKVLKEQWGASEELLHRTRDEARLLARLHHKNILRVEGLAQIEGQQAIVMEFVDGVDLKQLIEELASRGQRIPPRPAYRIALGAASALQAAYAKVPYGRTEPLSVVHRDLKPSNVMVSCEGEVKVLDFGTARFTHEARAAKTGMMRFGSMKYMSPERRLGDRGEHPSDVYSLGLLLMEMLRGEQLPLLPVERRDHDAAITDIIARLDNLGLPNADWRHSLEQMLHRMCHHDADARLDAQQVVDLLRAFADQADGPGLETWAATDVSRIARAVYGDGIDGALSGSQVFMHMSSGGPGVGSMGTMGVSSGGRGVPAPAPSPAAPPAPDNSGGYPSGVITRNGPGRTPVGAPPGGSIDGGAPVSHPSSLADEPTMVQGFDPSQAGYDHTEPEVQPHEAAPGGRHDLRSHATRSGPQRGYEPTAPEAHVPAQPAPMRIQPGRASDAPAQPPAPAPAPARPPAAVPPPPSRTPSHAPASKGNNNLLLIGIASVAAGGLVIGGAGLAGALWWMNRTPSVETAAPPSGSTAAVDSDGASVTLVASSSTLQWLKLTGPDGARLLKASPEGTASVAPGEYTLSAKIVGRQAVSGPLSVTAATTWTCSEGEAGKVACESSSGDSLTLAP